MSRQNIWFALAVIAFLVGWEAFGGTGAPGTVLFPPPSQILAQYWNDSDLYLMHIAATVRTAALGFVFGNAVAISAAIMFCRFPTLEQVFRGVNITLFAVPMIVIGPVLVLIFREGLPQIILSAVAVYFPTMAATLVGLRDIDPRLADVVRNYGGGEMSLMRFVRLRASLPSILAGLRVAASLSVLGAILGEFGSGERWGLGTFLLSALGQVDSARLWGISLAAAAIAMAGYGAFAVVARYVVGATIPVTLAANSMPDQIARAGRYRSAQRSLMLIVAVLMPFLLWWLIVRVIRLSPIIAPSPIEIVSFFVSPAAVEARAKLLTALGQTLPLAGLGLAFGLAAAFVLAALSMLQPKVTKAMLPVALVLQSTPLVALAPIILLFFGRDTASSIVMAILVVFFPAFVMLAQGLALVPNAALEVVQAYGGNRGRQLALVSIPYSVRYLFAAAKLVAPRALLGVMVAEWLLSGTGLGNLLNVSRGALDYEIVWGGALVSILVAVAAYEAVSLAERLVAW
jgi:ABC-type nitrate/sulfonate/bicarbonate transport system permease component